jgi:hypothetical protein
MMRAFYRNRETAMGCWPTGGLVEEGCGVPERIGTFFRDWFRGPVGCLVRFQRGGPSGAAPTTPLSAKRHHRPSPDSVRMCLLGARRLTPIDELHATGEDRPMGSVRSGDSVRHSSSDTDEHEGHARLRTHVC